MRIIVGEAGAAGMAVWLRAPTGLDELAVADGDPAAATALLGRLVCGADGTGLAVERLTVTQCDRLLAAVYMQLYGQGAECRVRCRACGAAYEFTLDLPALMRAQDAAHPGPPSDDGTWALPDGRRVRAPVLADLAAAGTPAALLARLVVRGDGAAEPALVSAFLERAAPALALDLDAPCPHCGAAQEVRFDIAGYLMRRIAGERPFLVRETHLIASGYGWSHGEIMALTRADRRAYAGLIEGERAARHARRAG